MFIVLEGPDGSGKSTQAGMLFRRLQQRGIPALLTREPGGTPVGCTIRDILHQHNHVAISPQTELFLFCADRAQHVQDVIIPALRAGTVVVCDRFTDSTLAYQGYGHGLDLATVEEVSRWSAGGIEPTLRILLDLPVEEGLRRKQIALTQVDRKVGVTAEWTRMDALDVSFHRRVREGYLRLAASGRNWITVDAAAPAEETHAAVWQAVATQLGLHTRGGRPGGAIPPGETDGRRGKP